MVGEFGHHHVSQKAGGGDALVDHLGRHGGLDQCFALATGSFPTHVLFDGEYARRVIQLFADVFTDALQLAAAGAFTDDLFAPIQPAHSQRAMAVLDSINAKWGRGTLRPGVVPATPAWSMRRELMSQSFTTRVDQLWKVSAG